MAINCEMVWREISSYIDADVEPVLRTEMDAHFAHCKSCSSVLDGTRNVIRWARDPRAFPAPPGFSQRLSNNLSKRMAEELALALVISAMGTRTWWASALPACLILASWAALKAHERGLPSVKSEHSQPAVRIIPAMVAIDEQGKTFHVPTCPYLHGKYKLVRVETTIQRGFVPCARCEEGYLAA